MDVKLLHDGRCQNAEAAIVQRRRWAFYELGANPASCNGPLPQLGVHGPAELRITWEPDPEPYELGDAEDPAETVRHIETYGVFGCIVEMRRPACQSWEPVASLWGVVGNDEYWRAIEHELLKEAA